MFEILTLLFLITLVSPFITGLFKKNSGYILAITPFIGFIYFLFYLPNIINNQNILKSTPWFYDYGVNFTFYLDGLSILFALLITGIGTLIFVYSSDYLDEKAGLKKYYFYLLMFTFSMLGLVLASNLITLFVFWELTSISSYLLIGFDSHKIQARDAALKSLLITNIGGLSLLAGFIFIYTVTNTYEIIEILKTPDILRQNQFYTLILILVCIGAFTKSAQFPFHFWLPAAMQAPTPVSAYLHSATMVVAGVYLLARLHPLLSGTMTWFMTLSCVGSITMLTSIILAIRERDIKLILAYTTVAALGLMTFMLSSDQREMTHALVAFILTHALYKSALFLASGNIQKITNNQDIYKMHSLRRSMPITYLAVVISALSMAGIPPLLGYYVKELVYEAHAILPVISEIYVGIVVVTNMGFLMVALMLMLKPFLGNSVKKINEPNPVLYICALIPSVLTLIFGVLPFLIDTSILSPAATAIQHSKEIIHLKLWHGFTAPFLITLITLLGGLILYLERQTVLYILNYFKFIYNHGPEYVYIRAAQGLVYISDLQTKIIQNGRLAIYLLVTLSSVALVLGTSLLFTKFDFAITEIDFSWYSVFLLFWLIACAIATVTARSLVVGVIFLGAFGLGVALFFLVNAAPDVAMTQVLVETLFVIIFVLTLYKLPKLPSLKIKDESPVFYISKITIATLTGLIVTVLLLVVISTPMNTMLGDFFIRNSLSLGHGHNIVNVILIDFRAFDTMGEVIVLVIAALGVYGLIKRKFGGGWL